MNKIKLLFILLVPLVLISCSPEVNDSKNKVSELVKYSSNSVSSKQESSSTVSSQRDDTQYLYEELCKVMKVDNDSDIVSLNSLQGICRRVGGLSMMRPTGYEFKDVKKVTFDKLNWYFRSAAFNYPYYENIVEENERLQSGALYLNYEQTMMIIKNEFEVDYFPFKVYNKEKLKVDISAGPDPHINFIKTIKKEDTITVQADILEVEKATMSNMDVFVKMEYTFKLRDNGAIVPISARRI